MIQTRFPPGKCVWFAAGLTAALTTGAGISVPWTAATALVGVVLLVAVRFAAEIETGLVFRALAAAVGACVAIGGLQIVTDLLDDLGAAHAILSHFGLTGELLLWTLTAA